MHIFFFKHKTAYEMRIRDWSSDLCSSDLSRCAARHYSGDTRSQFHASPPAGRDAPASVFADGPSRQGSPRRRVPAEDYSGQKLRPPAPQIVHRHRLPANQALAKIHLECDAIGRRSRGIAHNNILGDELVGPVIFVEYVPAPHRYTPALIQRLDARAQIDGLE